MRALPENVARGQVPTELARSVRRPRATFSCEARTKRLLLYLLTGLTLVRHTMKVFSSIYGLKLFNLIYFSNSFSTTTSVKYEENEDILLPCVNDGLLRPE